MSETKTLKDAVAKALYLEFRQENNTYQAVITPEVIDLHGNVRKATALTRKISVWHPRRNWNFEVSKNSVLTGRRDPGTGGALPTDLDHAGELAFQSMPMGLAQNLARLVSQNYEMFKTPVVVELSYEDVDTISAMKTPVGLIRRIQRTRVAAGWGEDFINPLPVPAPTPAASVQKGQET